MLIVRKVWKELMKILKSWKFSMFIFKLISSWIIVVAPLSKLWKNFLRKVFVTSSHSPRDLDQRTMSRMRNLHDSIEIASIRIRGSDVPTCAFTICVIDDITSRIASKNSSAWRIENIRSRFWNRCTRNCKLNQLKCTIRGTILHSRCTYSYNDLLNDQ